MASEDRVDVERPFEFQIYTMFVNRKNLMEIALQSLGKYMDRVVILDNSPEQNLVLPDFPGEIIVPPVPLYCNQSYNLIQKMAEERNQEIFFMMHSDAKASPRVVEALLAYAEEYNEQQRKWGVLFTNTDVFCLLNTSILKGIHWTIFCLYTIQILTITTG